MDLSDIKKLSEKKEKRNLDQLEAVMYNVVQIFKRSMENAAKRNLNFLELKFNLKFLESFEPIYAKRFGETNSIQSFIMECDKNRIKVKIKLKGKDVLLVKASWKL